MCFLIFFELMLYLNKSKVFQKSKMAIFLHLSTKNIVIKIFFEKSLVLVLVKKFDYFYFLRIFGQN